MSEAEQWKESVAAARKGDIDAFEEIVRATQGMIRGYLRARMRDWASADDLAQDVYVTAFLKIQKFRGDAALESWLLGIARNHLRNFLRKHREEAVGDSEDLQALIDRSCDEWAGDRSVSQRMDALRNCVAKLPDSARDLLEQRYQMGNNVSEIAEETGKGYSALTMQFHRMRKLLAECIEKELQQNKT